MYKNIFLVYGLLILATGFLQASPQAEVLEKGVVRIAAAANLAAVAPALTAAFRGIKPEIKLEWTFASSGSLTNQILNGAPYDIFLSADTSFPQQIQESGFATTAPQVYAFGLLILFSNGRVDLSKGVRALGETVGQFAMANPETAPYGRAARQVLKKAGLWESLSSRAVFGQSITQAKQMALTATGLGFIHKSALGDQDMAPYQREGTFWINVDPALYDPLEQSFVILKGATPLVEDFRSFVVGPEARNLLAQAGYGTP